MLNSNSPIGPQDSDSEFTMIRRESFPSAMRRMKRSSPGRFQLSLLEVGFVITLVASLISVFQYISVTPIFFFGGSLAWCVLVRSFPTVNPVLGGLIGFGTASMIVIVIGLIIEPGLLYAGVACTAVGLGYIFGSGMAQFEGVD